MKKITLIISCFLFIFTSCVSAADKTGNPKQEDNLGFQQQASDYRQEGLKFQDAGDLDSALKLYQKAVELDPMYSVVYNDLGVIYEAKGMPERAEANYLKAIDIDPYYLSAYSNLALFYEGKRDLNKAAYYWRKRAELGDQNDSWTLKAKERLKDIQAALSPDPVADAKNTEVIDLLKDVADEKYALRHDDKALARKIFKEAKYSYAKEDYATAIKKAVDAQYLDPDNKDIQKFIEKTQNRALAR